VKYAFVQRHEKIYPIEVMCKVLRASRSGYYVWRQRRVSPRQLRRQELLEQIIKIYDDSRGNYGSPRITRELRKNGIVVNRKTVEELMKENSIQAKRKKKFKATTNSNHNLPIAKNLLKRNFKTEKLNQAWVGDITYIPTEEGWLYLATCIDLFSRKVVGWSMSSRMTADIVVDAFRMALFRQKRNAPQIMHSDRGSQYASDAFRDELKLHGCKQSMSRKGDCWDNAVAESFFGSLKTELVHHEKYKTREAARLSIFDYIEMFYNRRRLHSFLNYLSPEEFEKSMVTA
jgi:transposase InsO family protein